MHLYQKLIETKIGTMLAMADDTHLLLLHFIDKPSIEKDKNIITTSYNSNILNESNQVLDQLERELSLYFEGRLTDFTIPLKFDFGTPFQQNVWRALCNIPYGETISYKQLAENIGNPTGFRAAANANGRNQITILVPCHRVIASDGGLGGYSSGIERKKHLLTLEQ